MFVVITRGEIEKRRKRGASGSGIKTPWDTDYDAMALKSAVRALWAFLPKSSEMAMAVSVKKAHERAFAVLPTAPTVNLLAELNGDPQPEPAEDETMADEPDEEASESGCGA